MTDNKSVARTAALVREVTQVLIQAGYTVAPAPKTLDGDLCVSVTAPKGSHCLVAFWPTPRAWPLAVYRGDELFSMGDSARELLAIVKRCLTN